MFKSHWSVKNAALTITYNKTLKNGIIDAIIGLNMATAMPFLV